MQSTTSHLSTNPHHHNHSPHSSLFFDNGTKRSTISQRWIQIAQWQPRTTHSVHSHHSCWQAASNQSITKGYFLAICNGLRTDSGEVPFGNRGSSVRRAAQNLLREYIHKWKGRTTSDLLVTYSPSSFFDSASAVCLNSLISLHTIPQIPSINFSHQHQPSPNLVSPLTIRSPQTATRNNHVTTQ